MVIACPCASSVHLSSGGTAGGLSLSWRVRGEPSSARRLPGKGNGRCAPGFSVAGWSGATGPDQRRARREEVFSDGRRKQASSLRGGRRRPRQRRSHRSPFRRRRLCRGADGAAHGAHGQARRRASARQGLRVRCRRGGLGRGGVRRHARRSRRRRRAHLQRRLRRLGQCRGGQGGGSGALVARQHARPVP